MQIRKQKSKKTKEIGYGFGKTILFGEHFVVYGFPGIVAALGHKSEVAVKKLENFPHKLIDNSNKFPGVEKLTWEICEKSITRILKHLKIIDPLEITLGGDLPIPNSGIGSSAAQLVAFTRALNKLYNLNLTEEQINLSALEGEKEIHGDPSGIDNTAATYGGIFWFEKEKHIKPIKLQKPIKIILVESGIKTIASKTIKALKDLITKDKNFVDNIFKEYKTIVKQAHQALINNNLKLLGSLMNKNHELLQKLTLSCPKLDNIVKIALENNALGAKLTGAGRGGLALILAPTTDIQEKVSNALELAGYAVLKTKF